MVIKNASFVTSAAKPGDRIVSDLIQIAVVGKSNVGKSSFINYITGDGKLAHTSKQPGRTRLINYFLINNGEFLLTDLPGYGFAKVSREEKKKWGELMEDYLRNEQALAHVFFLVDIRHDPTADDYTMYDYLFRTGLPFTVIATKSDKLSKSMVKNRVRHIASLLKLGEKDIIPVSSVGKTGKEEVMLAIDRILAAESVTADSAGDGQKQTTI